MGIDVLPANDLVSVKYVDTLDVETGTILNDSLITSKTSRSLIGSYNDPVFGRVDARTFTQLDLQGSNVNFGTSPTIDSVYFFLYYTNYYGDTLSEQEFAVYELSENIDDSKLYYSTNTISYSSNPIADTTFRPHPMDIVFGIRLDNSFGQNILNANSTTLSSNSEFIKTFKGIAIIPKTRVLPEGLGAVFTYDLAVSATKLILYYHNTDDTLNHSYSLAISSSTPRFHQIERIYKSAELQNTEIYPDSDKVKSFLQGGAYARMFLKIKDEDIAALKNIAINNAEIILTVDTSVYGTNSIYPPPYSLTVTEADENKNDIDFLVDYVSYKSSEHAYHFTVNSYLQRILSGQKENNGMLISVYSAGITVSRAVIGGGTNSTLKPKLKIYYTTLPQ